MGAGFGSVGRTGMVATYILNILIGIDQFCTTLIGGYPDETLSSYAYRMELQGARIGKYVRPFIDGILFFDPNHCQQAWQSERDRRQSPPELR
jgi:hypothetical protein